jgi:hypothetical protein
VSISTFDLPITVMFSSPKRGHAVGKQPQRASERPHPRGRAHALETYHELADREDMHELRLYAHKEVTDEALLHMERLFDPVHPSGDSSQVKWLLLPI